MKGDTVVKQRARIMKIFPVLVEIEMPCSVGECGVTVSV